MIFLCRRISIYFLLLTVCSGAFALDLTDMSNILSESFYGISGENEGTTGFRSLLIPSGGRPESLGSAYTGLCDDISFFDYNPAASSILEQTEIALFHNSWIADSAMETIAATTRFNNFGIGGKISCFYVPFTEYDAFGTRTASNYYSETTAVLNASYNLFPGYKFRGLAVGTNLKFCWRSVPDYTDNYNGRIISNSGLAQSALAFMADIGILTQFNLGKLYYSRDTNCKAGLSITNLGAAVTGFSESLKIDDPLPTTIGIGFSYKIIRPVTMTVEFRQPINLGDFSEYQMFYIGSGVCVDIAPFFSVLGGFQLKGANPRFSIGSEFEVLKVRFNINYSLDLTTSFNPVNRISLSAKIRLGDKGRSETKNRIDELYQEGFSFYANGEYERAIETWKEILLIDKNFDPAKEAIISTEKYTNMLSGVQSLSTYTE